VVIEDSTSTELLYTVSKQLNSSLDLNEVLGKVLGLTVQATGAGRGSLFLLDETGNVVRQILARPNQSPEVSRTTVHRVMKEGLAGWVYQHRQPALVTDTTKDERWVRLPDDKDIMGAALVIPLLYQDQINGLLALHHKQINFFTDEHLSLAIGIAGQAATAVENARLFTQVKSEHEALYALISGMPIPVLLVNDERVVFRNRAAEQLLLVYEVDVPLTAIAGGNELNLALKHLRTNGDTTSIEIRWPDNRVFNVSTNYVSQHGMVVAFHDITYLKELDDMKSLFVETVSHDLKSPLSAIKGYATVLTFSKDLSDRDKANLASILQSTEKMQALIENLLDLAEIEAGLGGHVEPCDIVEITQEVIDQYQLRIEEKEINLTTHFPQGLVEVMADPMRLSQVVGNYISNAIKYTPEGGRIIIRGHNQGPEISLEVSDTGMGIPPAAQAQLFQKFYRVARKDGSELVEGTGLGLSIVKAIIEGYGGRVWVKSEVGIGSTFGCTLPVIDGKTAS